MRRHIHLTKIANSLIFVTVLVLLNRVIMFFKDIVFVNFYGATHFTDAYSIAFSSITTLETVISSITLAYLPIYFECKKKGTAALNSYVKSVFLFIGILCILIGSLGFIFTSPIITIMAPGFYGTTLNITIDYFRLFLPSFPLYMVVAIQQQQLRAEGNYWCPALVNFFVALLLLGATYFSRFRYGINGIIIAFTLIFLFQLIFQSLFCDAPIHKQPLTSDFDLLHIKKLCLLSFPMFLGGSLEPLTTMIAKSASSLLGEGDVTIMNYALKFAILVVGVFTMGPGNMLYAQMAQLAQEQKEEQFNLYYIEVIKKIIYLSVPIVIVLITQSQTIINILFFDKTIEPSQIEVLCTVFNILSLSILAHILRIIVTRAFFAYKKIFLPNCIAALTLALQIGLIIVLLNKIGIIGIAVVTSCVIWLNALVLLYSFGLSRQIKNIYSFVAFMKIVLCGGATCLIIKISEKLFLESSIPSILSFISISLIGIIAFYIISRLLHIKESKTFYKF